MADSDRQAAARSEGLTMSTQGFKRFRYYRTSPPAEYVKTGAAVAADKPQFEGVQFSDGTVCLHWYTLSGSHAIWPSMAEVMQIHGHPEYGGRFEWLPADV